MCKGLNRFMRSEADKACGSGGKDKGKALPHSRCRQVNRVGKEI